MIRCLVCFLLLSPFISLCQQQNEKFYGFDANGNTVPSLEKSTTFMHMVQENDTSFVCKFYHKNGTMFRWETYRNGDYEIPHGRFAWYNSQGKVDSTGIVFKGKKHGYWDYYSPVDGKLIKTHLYDYGLLMNTYDFVAKTITERDSNNAFITRPIPEKELSGKPDDPTEKAAVFKGGVNGWVKYLEKNLRTPERFKQLFRPGTKASVVVDFMIGADGFIQEIYIVQSVEWSVDAETLRVLKAAPSWQPAIQDGKPVKYRHRQSISYALESF